MALYCLNKTVLLFLALVLKFSAAREIVIGDGQYVFDWEIEDNFITITATVATTGYIGFGSSPFGDMYGADLFLGGVHSNGSTYYGVRTFRNSLHIG